MRKSRKQMSSVTQEVKSQKTENTKSIQKVELSKPKYCTTKKILNRL